MLEVGCGGGVVGWAGLGRVGSGFGRWVSSLRSASAVWSSLRKDTHVSRRGCTVGARARTHIHARARKTKRRSFREARGAGAPLLPSSCAVVSGARALITTRVFNPLTPAHPGFSHDGDLVFQLNDAKTAINEKLVFLVYQ